MRAYVDMTKAEKAFNAGVEYLSRLTGIDRRRIVMAEAGSVLKACAADTKVTELETVEKGAILRALRGSDLTRGGQFTVNAGIKKGAPIGRVFMLRTTGNSKAYRRTHNAPFIALNQHYRDADWKALEQTVALAQEKINRAARRAPESIALARGSWVLIADALGIRLESVPGGRLSPAAIAKARAAKARRGQQVKNARGMMDQSPGKFFVTLVNLYPGGNALGFQRTLAAKVTGRALFMAKALQKGFDGSAEQTARLFPGWTVRRSP